MEMNRERWAGVSVIGVGALILICILFFLSSSGSRALRYDVVFRNAQGLKVGDRVQMSGFDIGEIDAIKLADDGKSVAVRLKILADHRDKVRLDSTAAIASPTTFNVSGQKVIAIHNSSRPSPPMRNGAVVEGKDNTFELTAWSLKGKVEEWSESVSKASKDFGEGAREVTESLRKSAETLANEISQGIKEGLTSRKDPLRDAPIDAPAETNPETPSSPSEGPAPQTLDPAAPSRARETMKNLTEFLGEIGSKGKENLGELMQKWDALKQDLGPVLKDLTDRGLEYLKTKLQSLMKEIEEQLRRLQESQPGPTESPADPNKGVEI